METVGSIQVVATINTKDYDAGKKHIEKGNTELESNAKKTSKGFSAAWTGAIAGAVAAVVNKGMSVISNSIDGAIKRVDTLNNSARTFENMGIKATDSAKAMSALEKSITGLPTPLDSAVRGMTALTATYGDIGKGQKIFSALNNAILGFGGSSAMVDNAITQLSQLPMDGPLDAQTWNSLRNSGITPVLTAMAKDSGMSVSEMKKAFGEGELTVQDFTDRLLKLDKEGGGGLTSLEKIAKDSTKGIGTGFSNMQTAVTRGLAEVMEAIGSENISSTITIIGKAFETALKAIATVITELPGAIQKVIDTLTEMGNFVKDNAVAIGAFAVAVGALAAPFAIAAASAALFNLQLKILIARAKVTSMLKGIAGGIKAINVAMRANPIGLVISAIALLVAGFMLLWKNNEGFRKFFIKSWNNIKKTFTNVVDSIKGVFGTIGGFFTGVWQGVVAIFNGVVEFFKKWGLTIIAVAFWPISLAIGTIITHWEPIKAFFQGIWESIKAVFSGVAGFFIGIFKRAWDGIVTIFSPVVNWFGSVFKRAWNGIVIAFNVYKAFFTAVWNGIKSIFNTVNTWFRNKFQAAWTAIKNVFSPVGSFFSGIWNTIKSRFTSVGRSVGNAMGGAFRGAINGILRFAGNQINGLIRNINGAIGTINKIPGVNIPRIGNIAIPQLATGGITTGPTLAMIGEGREQEAVLPLSKLDALLSNSGGDDKANTVHVDTIIIEKDVDIDLVARKLGINQLQTRRGIA